MLVRDQTKPRTEYKGRPTQAMDANCPCRSCWNPHDCGYINSQGKWYVHMECATRWNGGCPRPTPQAEHIIPVRCHRCRRCGWQHNKEKENKL